MWGDYRHEFVRVIGVSTGKASVLICCYTFDRLDDTLAAIRSVLAQTLEPHEVIVAVDNNAALAAELERTLPDPVAVFLNDHHPGLSETRNVAVNKATGEI